ncbi:unnamed protein product [Linum trigynum]|uniref:Uncharacterized protein n=1 Tax=Linum trigynum TaxID=586398 RepID=A0AAV2CRB1_9ROSI
MAMVVELEQANLTSYTRCLVGEKVCSVYVNGESKSNLISSRAVAKLGLSTRKHPAPHSVSLLETGSSVFVTEEVTLPFKIGSYEDEVRCDVVPLKITHIVLGNPWHVDRGARRSRRTNHIRLRHCGTSFALKFLSPEEAADDQATLLKQVRGEEELLLAMEVSNKEQQPEIKLVEEELSDGVVRLCFPSTKQSMREGELAGNLGSELITDPQPNTFPPAVGSSSLELAGSSSTDLQKPDRAPTPLQLSEHDEQLCDLVGAIGAQSNSTNAADSVHTTPGMTTMKELDPKPADSQNSIWSKTPLETAELDVKLLEWVGEFGADSTQSDDSKPSRLIPGSCRKEQLDLELPESETPNSEIKILVSRNLTSYDGGKNPDDHSTRSRNNRCWKSIEKYNSMMDQADSSSRLQIGGSNPCRSTFDDFSEFVAKLGSIVKVLAAFPTLIIVDIDLGSEVEDQYALVLTKSSMTNNKAEGSEDLNNNEERLGCTFEDPFWAPSSRILAFKIIQALRAKLFEEGEPDMIQIGHFYKSKLLAKEAIKVGKKKGRIWLSLNPCSGYILWRHGSLNWLGGNSRLRVFFADKVSIFPMVCFVDPYDVIKVFFQGLKVATSKLENCQNLVKAETVFKKPTLELHSRSMDEIRVQRLIPHESRYVLLQRHGIG